MQIFGHKKNALSECNWKGGKEQGFVRKIFSSGQYRNSQYVDGVEKWGEDFDKDGTKL
jgi:hypothetical protein